MHVNASIAQLVERSPCKREVSGSIPDGGTFCSYLGGNRLEAEGKEAMLCECICKCGLIAAGIKMRTKEKGMGLFLWV